jgi:hypothetical protein
MPIWNNTVMPASSGSQGKTREPTPNGSDRRLTITVAIIGAVAGLVGALTLDIHEGVVL